MGSTRSNQRELLALMRRIYNAQKNAVPFAPVVTALKRAYPRQELRDTFNTLIGALDSGQPIPPALEQLSGRLLGLFTQYAGQIEQQARAAERPAQVAGYEQALRILELGRGNTQLAPTLQSIMAASRYTDEPAFHDILNSYGPFHAGRATNAFTSAMIEGNNLNVLARQLRASFTDGNALPLFDAIRLCRTLPLYAYRSASNELYKQQGIEKWLWSAALDDRTCPSCWAMHGRVFLVALAMLNDHHLGRCASVPLTQTWEALLGIQGFDAPPDLTGVELFNELPETRQRQILDGLGKNAFQSWKDGVFNFNDIPGTYQNALFGEMRRARTANELGIPTNAPGGTRPARPRVSAPANIQGALTPVLVGSGFGGQSIPPRAPRSARPVAPPVPTTLSAYDLALRQAVQSGSPASVRAAVRAYQEAQRLAGQPVTGKRLAERIVLDDIRRASSGLF